MQLAQACHVTFQFAREYPQLTISWMDISNYIAILQVENEAKLHELIEKASSRAVVLSIFKEPDMNNEITAIALEPGEKSKKLCSNFKLALK